jgi:signal transduction histidine kinase
MVLDILYYAKDRALDWKRLDVVKFAEDVVEIVSPKFENHPIEFQKQFETSLGEFEVDAVVAATALTNIIENAVEACTEDRSGRAHRIVFSVGQDKDNIIFEVRDNGIGMSREIRDSIFKLFFSSKGQKGTGLGLFIARNIVKQHGGTIQVASSPGQGSEFRVIMPKVLPREAKESEN